MNEILKKAFWPFLVFTLVFAAVKLWPSKVIDHPPGILAAEDPIQNNLKKEKILTKDGYNIYLKATFDIKARILSIEEYSRGRESDLSPMDFALGWGRMSDQSVLDKIDISQRGRWYYWKTDRFPIPRREIEVHSANMHIIPANENVEDELENFYVGNVVELTGYLVYVGAADGWKWKSSLTRQDVGNHACEVVYVEKVKKIL